MVKQAVQKASFGSLRFKNLKMSPTCSWRCPWKLLLRGCNSSARKTNIDRSNRTPKNHECHALHHIARVSGKWNQYRVRTLMIVEQPAVGVTAIGGRICTDSPGKNAAA